MFMYTTQLNNIDNMIPAHADRIAQLVQLLGSAAGESCQEEPRLAMKSTEEPGSSQGEELSWALDLAKGFQEEADTNMPEIIGHRGRLIRSSQITEYLLVVKIYERSSTHSFESPYFYRICLSLESR